MGLKKADKSLRRADKAREIYECLGIPAACEMTNRELN